MKNLLVNRAVSTAKKNFNLRWLLVPILLIILGVGYVWGAEGDTYDFSQTLSQVLNNGAAIADVTVAEQTYTVKEVNVTVNYNKSRPGATVSVKVGGVTFGSPQTINSNKTTTFTFTGASAVKGQVVVSSTNNCTSSSGNGTFKITNVRLVEGATGSTKTLHFPSHKSGHSFLPNLSFLLCQCSSCNFLKCLTVALYFHCILYFILFTIYSIKYARVCTPTRTKNGNSV